MSSIVTQRFIKCHDKIREEKRVRSSRQFALELDYLPQSLSEILKGRRDVTIELLRKAIELHRINPGYLFTGEEPMFLPEEKKHDLQILTIVTDPAGTERIVHVPVPAQAGYAGENANPSFIQDLPTFSLPDYKYRTGTFRSFDVAGDSMEPTLLEGDKVVCSFIEPMRWETDIKDNQVYVVVSTSDVLVKRVFNKIAENRTIELHSDNRFYSPYSLSVDKLREMWRVQTRIGSIHSAALQGVPYLPSQIADLKKQLEEQSRLIRQLQGQIEKMMNSTI